MRGGIKTHEAGGSGSVWRSLALDAKVLAVVREAGRQRTERSRLLGEVGTSPNVDTARENIMDNGETKTEVSENGTR